MSLEQTARRHALVAVLRSSFLHGVLVAAWFVAEEANGASLRAPAIVIIAVSFVVPLAVTLTLPLKGIADRLAAEVTPASAELRFRNVTEELALGLGERVEAVGTHRAEEVNVLSLPTSGGAVVVATTGAIENLTRRELQAVVAAQFAGLRDRWCRVATRAEIMWWAIRFPIGASFVAGLLTGNAAPAVTSFLMLFVVLFLPRSNEQARDLCADVAAIRLTFDPEALASAMRKIGSQPDDAHDVTLGSWKVPVNPFLVLPRRAESKTSVQTRGKQRSWTSTDEVRLEFELRADRAEALAAGADPRGYTGREFRRRWGQLGADG